MANHKQKFALWAKPSTLQIVEDHYKKDNCGSRSAFIEKAVLFYCSYLAEKDSSRFLNKALVSTLSGLLGDIENRIATILFKLAVEMSMMMNVLASQVDIDDETMRRLRIKCVEQAKRTNGAIDFAKVVRYQNGRE